MNNEPFIEDPFIIEENENFGVVFKPAKMHCINNKPSENSDTILDWYKARANSVFDIMHRLDYETNGLVLFAKNEKSFLKFKEAQDNGEFIKEYSAICAQEKNILEGFPEHEPQSNIIESYFRPFGPGRKQVRPVIDEGKKNKELAKDKGGFYQTEIMNKTGNLIIARIKRGFRHQIRCHLCWIGLPIQNDPIYSQESVGEMALRSHALYFPDPETGKQLEFRIPNLANTFPKNVSTYH